MEQQTSTVHHNKSLERVISQRALQMSSSFSWMSWVVGFLFGILFTYFLLASMTSFTNPEFGRSSYSASPVAFSYNNSGSGDCRREKEKYLGGNSSINTGAAGDDDRRVEILYSAWSAVLNGSKNGDEFVRTVGLERSSVPYAPHLEDCDYNVDMYETFDRRVKEEDFPPWSIWKGSLGLELLRESNSSRKSMHKGSGADYPPWIVGSDEDNFPLTRRVQRDIWIHQHPLNCSDSNLRFLVADWEKSPGFGIGAQIVGMTGLLAIAIKEKRTLVTNYYNRADHDGCKDSHRCRWSCYFLPETSQECRDRSLELLKHQEAWENGVITTKENYTSKEIWSGRIPRKWGSPWQYLQPTTVIEGSLVTTHRKMDLRWWRAQATRYLMRFKSSYTCNLLNVARHEAFGRDAAKMVVETLSPKWPQVTDVTSGRSDYHAVNRLVWSNHGPWMPKPILSMHVRMGDKAVEMNVVGFEEYMNLADLLRQHLPNVNNIWLSTEMQEVTDKARRRRRWNFYYTNVSRQVGNSSMASYEASLGRETSTNYPLVNFMMAVEADYFIGALGSTWCYLIDAMRNTGGKVMAGYLSVNRDRFW